MITGHLTFDQILPMADGPLSGEASANHGAARRQTESSFVLVQRAQEGDLEARNELFARYLPRLRRWAHGRLPASARGAHDTQDLVQDTLTKVLKHLAEFHPRHEGAFQGYLRQSLLNNVRDLIRRANRQSPAEPLESERPATDPSPLEVAIGRETLERYDAALQRLRESDREIIHLRIELNYSWAEVAEALNKPSAPAAQMAAHRALLRLAEEMCHGQE